MVDLNSSPRRSTRIAGGRPPSEDPSVAPTATVTNTVGGRTSKSRTKMGVRKSLPQIDTTPSFTFGSGAGSRMPIAQPMALKPSAGFHAIFTAQRMMTAANQPQPLAGEGERRQHPHLPPSSFQNNPLNNDDELFFPADWLPDPVPAPTKRTASSRAAELSDVTEAAPDAERSSSVPVASSYASSRAPSSRSSSSRHSPSIRAATASSLRESRATAEAEILRQSIDEASVHSESDGAFLFEELDNARGGALPVTNAPGVAGNPPRRLRTTPNPPPGPGASYWSAFKWGVPTIWKRFPGGPEFPFAFNWDLLSYLTMIILVSMVLWQFLFRQGGSNDVAHRSPGFIYRFFPPVIPVVTEPEPVIPQAPVYPTVPLGEFLDSIDPDHQTAVLDKWTKNGQVPVYMPIFKDKSTGKITLDSQFVELFRRAIIPSNDIEDDLERMFSIWVDFLIREIKNPNGDLANPDSPVSRLYNEMGDHFAERFRAMSQTSEILLVTTKHIQKMLTDEFEQRDYIRKDQLDGWIKQYVAENFSRLGVFQPPAPQKPTWINMLAGHYTKNRIVVLETSPTQNYTYFDTHELPVIGIQNSNTSATVNPPIIPDPINHPANIILYNDALRDGRTWCPSISRDTPGVAQVGIRAHFPFYIHNITYDALPKGSYMDPRSAPREFELWIETVDKTQRDFVQSWYNKIYREPCSASSLPSSPGMVCIFKFGYDIHDGPPTQTSKIRYADELQEAGVHVKHLVIRVTKTWGREWPCLHHLMVGGEPVDPIEQPDPPSERESYYIDGL